MFKILKVVPFLISALCFAGDVRVEWDHSPSTDVTGYKIYYGKASNTYTGHITVGYQTTATVTGLSRGTWFMAATAYNGDGESGYSNEVSTTLGGCDVNKDGSTDILDLQILYNMILGTAPVDLQYDFNIDGSINIMDSQILTNVILGKIECP